MIILNIRWCFVLSPLFIVYCKYVSFYHYYYLINHLLYTLREMRGIVSPYLPQKSWGMGLDEGDTQYKRIEGEKERRSQGMRGE